MHVFDGRRLHVLLLQHQQSRLENKNTVDVATGLHRITYPDVRKSLWLSFTLPLYTDFPGQLQSKAQSLQLSPRDTHQLPQASKLYIPSG